MSTEGQQRTRWAPRGELEPCDSSTDESTTTPRHATCIARSADGAPTTPKDTRASESVPVVASEVDFTVLLLAHDAFTRDTHRLAEACLLGRAGSQETAATWSTITRQIRIHHRAENEVLWPRLRASASKWPAAADTLANEREYIGLALTAADDIYHAGHTVAFYDVLNQLSGRLGLYIWHHEQLALPLIGTQLSPASWAAYTLRLRQLQGPGGTAEYLPWLLDGATASMSASVLASQPIPIRALYRAVWSRRFRRTHLPDQRP